MFRTLTSNAWRAVVDGGISGDMIRHMMLEAVEARLGGLRAQSYRMALLRLARTPRKKRASLRKPSLWRPASHRPRAPKARACHIKQALTAYTAIQMPHH